MRITLAAWLISFGLVQQACQKPNEVADGRPAIKAISFVGIPDSDVRFDASNARITVRLPAILKGGLQPILELTDGTSVVGLLADNTIDLTPYCHCYYSSDREVIIRVANKVTTSVYKLIVIASGPLKAQDSNAQLTFSRETKLLKMSFPVENLYGNPVITDLTFTNIQTGLAGHINADGICLNSCEGMAHNQLIFTIRSPVESSLLPGTYTIILGDIKFPQRLVVTD